MALILASALLLNACDKTKPVATTMAVPPATYTNQTSPSVISQTAASMPVISPNPEGSADLRQLNHAYLRWIAQNRRRPASYENFIELSGIQVPPAPSGKKYAIDKNGFIALANNP